MNAGQGQGPVPGQCEGWRQGRPAGSRPGNPRKEPSGRHLPGESLAPFHKGQPNLETICWEKHFTGGLWPDPKKSGGQGRRPGW